MLLGLLQVLLGLWLRHHWSKIWQHGLFTIVTLLIFNDLSFTQKNKYSVFSDGNDPVLNYQILSLAIAILFTEAFETCCVLKMSRCAKSMPTKFVRLLMTLDLIAVTP